MPAIRQRVEARRTRRVPRAHVKPLALQLTARMRRERLDLMALLHDREHIAEISVDVQSTHRSPSYRILFTNPPDIVNVYRQELVSLVGKQFTLFLEFTPDYVITDVMLMQLGLTESVNDHNDYSSCRAGPDWNIHSIYWDPEQRGFIAIDNADGLDYSVLLYSLFFEGAYERTSHKLDGSAGRFLRGSQSREFAILQIHSWCTQIGNHGRKLLMAHSRSRGPSTVTPRYRQMSYGSVPFQDGFDFCVQAAVCNSLGLLGSTESDRHWRYFVKLSRSFESNSELPPRIRDFRDVQKHLEQWHVTLLHVFRGRCPSIQEVLTLPSGVYVVTIDGTNGVIHSLVIDTSRRIILDCVEDYPLTLCQRALEGCVGDSSTLTAIRDVRKVHAPEKQERAKKPRHRNDGNNKKKRRRLAIEREKAKEAHRT